MKKSVDINDWVTQVKAKAGEFMRSKFFLRDSYDYGDLLYYCLNPYFILNRSHYVVFVNNDFP
jgi:hypothetical protein